MDISMLTAIILVGILLESFISERPHGQAEHKDPLVDRLAGYGEWE